MKIIPKPHVADEPLRPEVANLQKRVAILEYFQEYGDRPELAEPPEAPPAPVVPVPLIPAMLHTTVRLEHDPDGLLTRMHAKNAERTVHGLIHRDRDDNITSIDITQERR